jgi:hypothetical protein
MGVAMRDQTLLVAEQYIDAVHRNDGEALPLHPEVVAIFPLNTYHGASAYRKALEPFAKIVKNIEVQRLVADGEHCVALLEIETIFGRIEFAEHIHVRDGQIIFVRAYYDPRLILDGIKATA